MTDLQGRRYSTVLGPYEHLSEHPVMVAVDAEELPGRNIVRLTVDLIGFERDPDQESPPPVVVLFDRNNVAQLRDAFADMLRELGLTNVVDNTQQLVDESEMPLALREEPL